jgi:hypothetical protein
MALEGVEVAVPKAAVPIEPFFDRNEAVAAQRIDTALGFGADVDEPRLAQNAKVAGHRRLGEQRKGCDEVARSQTAARKPVEKGASIRFGDGLESIHVGLYKLIVIYVQVK